MVTVEDALGVVIEDAAWTGNEYIRQSTTARIQGVAFTRRVACIR